MAEQKLNLTEVGPGLQQMDGIGVPRPGLCRLSASQQLLTGRSVIIDAA